jgi:hypothetical protein
MVGLQSWGIPWFLGWDIPFYYPDCDWTHKFSDHVAETPKYLMPDYEHHSGSWDIWITKSHISFVMLLFTPTISDYHVINAMIANMKTHNIWMGSEFTKNHHLQVRKIKICSSCYSSILQCHLFLIHLIFLSCVLTVHYRVRWVHRSSVEFDEFTKGPLGASKTGGSVLLCIDDHDLPFLSTYMDL